MCIYEYIYIYTHTHIYRSISRYVVKGQQWVPNRGQAVSAMGLPADPVTLVLFTVYFSVVNPLLEELFWRVFLLHALGFSESAQWLSATWYM